MARETQKAKIERLENELKQKEKIIKELLAKDLEKDEELKNAEKRYQNLIKDCKKDIPKLKNNNNAQKIRNERGAGRKSRFTDTETDTIKLYRLQGKTIREIAETFNCSVGLVHKIINENLKGCVKNDTGI